MKQLPLGIRLRERALFDSFVAGGNDAVLAQLKSSSLGQGARVCWLWGAPGCGKTHLLQASCTLAIAADREAAYLPLAQLLPYGPGSLEGWQAAQLVALDEIDAVLGRREWEEALFTLYRWAEERGATLLAAAPALPAQLDFSLPDLASRFAGSLALSLQALDEDAQRQALQWRARARGLDLPDDSARYLQRHFRRDLPTLCGLLDAIDMAALQAQRRLTVPFIREVLALPPPRAE